MPSHPHNSPRRLAAWLLLAPLGGVVPACTNAVKGSSSDGGSANGGADGGSANGGSTTGGAGGAPTGGAGGGGTGGISMSFDGTPFAPTGEGRFAFGAAVAVSETGTLPTALVGANEEWVSAPGSGAAYVFVLDGKRWSQQTKLLPMGPDDNHQFGTAVALDGDTALVGAPYVAGGAAYVFVRSGTSWTEQAKLVGSDVQSGVQFGIAVALSGNTAVVGAPYDNAGAAYVFVRQGTVWTEQAKLTASDGAANDYLGQAVAIDEDTVVLGAEYALHVGPEAGAAYVFVRNSTTWTQETKLTASSGTPYDHLGTAVAIDGDRVVVTAIDEETNGQSAGAAYVFERSGNAWSEGIKLLASDGVKWDHFGRSASIRGDRLLIGADGVDGADINVGAVYVFLRDNPGGSWLQDAKLVPPVLLEEQFGTSVSVRDNIAAIGAPDFDSDRGRVYLWNVK